ncbi:hypothetical protein GGX14DRAFT_384723 [Mycena pura]|uniref:Uncharacterized protein n=1 Tax=Mycena pura TaxID=153505 RepID=A0AAD6YSH9_9AGAR|nr:hypothetical protein GGX14DRAFT_384723 [Mycena pura]
MFGKLVKAGCCEYSALATQRVKLRQIDRGQGSRRSCRGAGQGPSSSATGRRSMGSLSFQTTEKRSPDWAKKGKGMVGGAFGRSTSDGTRTRSVADRQNRTKEDTGGRASAAQTEARANDQPTVGEKLARAPKALQKRGTVSPPTVLCGTPPFLDGIEFRRDLGAGRQMNPPQPRGTTVTRKGMARARRGGPGGVTTGWGEVDTAGTARCFDGVCSGGRCSRTGDHDNRQGERAFGAFGRSTSDGTRTRSVADRQNRTKEDTGGRQKRR